MFSKIASSASSASDAKVIINSRFVRLHLDGNAVLDLDIIFWFDRHFSDLYYKHLAIINDASRVVSQRRHILGHHSGSVIDDYSKGKG